jgi:hypothetical protein
MTKAKRKKERFARQFHSEEFVEWTRQSRCVVHSCTHGVPSECAHNPSRGAGGTWVDVSPMCGFHHRQQHHIGVKKFQRLYGISFKQTNAAHTAKWEAMQCGF